MDDDGNVLIKRTGVSQVSILAAAETGDRRQADMLTESCGHMLGMDKTVELFDMNNFQKLLENSLRYSQGRINKQGLELQVQCTVPANNYQTEYYCSVSQQCPW